MPENRENAAIPRKRRISIPIDRMYDLNDLLVDAPPTSRLILAEAISCEGHITALGYDTRVSDGTSGFGGGPREHAYVLARIGPPQNCSP